MGFSRQEYWSGLPFPSPGDLPDPGIEPGSPSLEADAFTSEPPGKPMPFFILGGGTQKDTLEQRPRERRKGADEPSLRKQGLQRPEVGAASLGCGG